MNHHPDQTEHAGDGCGGTWTCDDCGRVWAWHTRRDEPCPLCGCEGGALVDFAVEAARKQLGAAIACARFLVRDERAVRVSIHARHLRALVAAVPTDAWRSAPP